MLFLAIALAIAGSYWIVPAFMASDKSTDGLALFREAGDPDYLPQVSWAAHLDFSETTVKEYAGTGVRSFPFVPVAIHAIFYRIAGWTGFILADVLMVVFYACLVRQFLLFAEVARRPAELLSLGVISGTLPWINDRVEAIAHHALPVLFWDFRFPRAFITEAVFVLFLTLATLLLARQQRPIWLYAAFGVSFAASLQSDIYSAFDAAFVVVLVSVFTIAAGSDRWATGKRVLAGGASFGVACLPFIYQQLHTSPDVKRRWGVYSTHRYWTLLPDKIITACALLFVVAALALAFLYRRREEKRGRIAALAVVATATAASIISGPASLAVLHQTVQIYHFWRQTMLTIGYLLLLYAGWLLTDIGQTLRLRRFSERRWSIFTAAAGTIFTLLCLFVAYRSSIERSRMGNPTAPAMRDNLHLDHYRADFSELHSVLDRPEYANATVLGTFDRQLSNWWLAKRRYVYTVETFNSTLPDSVMETRAFQFLQLAGTSSEELGQLLDNNYFLIEVMGLDKYQADADYTAWPLSDYAPDARRRIAATTWPFHLELPISEKARLMSAYEQTLRTPQTANALDVLVLDKDALRAYVHPEMGNRFRLAWSNGTFELWLPNNPAGAVQSR
jgi:hypothetical protein